MFPPMELEARRTASAKRERPEAEATSERYYLKAMNCPHHHRIFAAEPRSYRDLPLRLAEYGTCYRYEQSGELFGLMRVRSLNMNDAHIYCTEEQFAEEFNAVNEMYLKYFKIFGIEKYRHALQHARSGRRLGKKFVNEPELWKKTEDMVRNVLIESGINLRRSAQRSRVLRPEDRRAGLERHRPRIHPRDQPGGFRRAREVRPDLSRPRQHRQDAALHSSRAARHARAVHRLSDRALRRQFPALARARTGARADRSRTTASGLCQEHRQRIAFAKWSARSSSSAMTSFRAASSEPRKPGSTPC